MSPEEIFRKVMDVYGNQFTHNKTLHWSSLQKQHKFMEAIHAVTDEDESISLMNKYKALEIMMKNLK